MEPRKENDSVVKIANSENGNGQDNSMPEKQGLSENYSQTEKSTVTQEQTNLSELQKIEIKDNQQVTASSQTQARSTTDDSYQTVIAAVDPQDQLNEEEINNGIKVSPNNALSWLSQWWNRQIKILKAKK